MARAIPTTIPSPIRALGVRRQGNGHFAVTVFAVGADGAQALGDVALNCRSASEAEAYALAHAAVLGAHRVLVLPSARTR